MSSGRWLILGAILAALGLGVLIGVLVLDDGDDDERVVRITEGAGTDGSAPEPARELSVEDDGRPITDREIRRIAAAAVAAAGGGEVSDIERSDDPGEAFEVEVIRGGGEIDVALDENLRRVPNSRFSD